jgi:hypothetical protein
MDQLQRVRQSNPTLMGSFIEGKINFKPTYKYDIGTDTYDTSEKRRSPAWCDRILYRAAEGLNVKQEFYCRGELFTSDHRPVKTLLTLDIKIMDHRIKDKLKKELYKLFKTLDKGLIENTLETPYEIDPNIIKINDPPEILAIEGPQNKPIHPFLLEAAPIPPSEPYIPEILEEAPRPPSFSPTVQQTVLQYNTSIRTGREMMLNSYAQADKIMTTTNMIAGTVREILEILKKLPNNESAIKLTTLLFEQVKQLGLVARQYVGQLQDMNIFSSMISVIDTIIVLIDQHVPYLI